MLEHRTQERELGCGNVYDFEPAIGPARDGLGRNARVQNHAEIEIVISRAVDPVVYMHVTMFSDGKRAFGVSLIPCDRRQHLTRMDWSLISAGASSPPVKACSTIDSAGARSRPCWANQASL